MYLVWPHFLGSEKRFECHSPKPRHRPGAEAVDEADSKVGVGEGHG